MIDLISFFAGFGGLTMFYNLSHHDFADTRRVYIAFGLLVVSITAGIADHLLSRSDR